MNKDTASPLMCCVVSFNGIISLIINSLCYSIVTALHNVMQNDESAVNEGHPPPRKSEVRSLYIFMCVIFLVSLNTYPHTSLSAHIYPTSLYKPFSAYLGGLPNE